MTRAHWCGVALVGWLVVSIAWSPAPLDGFGEAAKLIVIAAAFAYGATLESIWSVVTGATFGIALSSIVATAQWYGFEGIEQTTHAFPAGLFYNHNRLAEAAVLVGVALIALRRFVWLPFLLPSIVLPQARGALLAAGVVMVALLLWRRRTFDRFVILMILFWLLVLAALTAPQWRSAALDERLILWSYAINNMTWLGHGLGSFSGATDVFLGNGIDASRAEHPHNEYLWLAFEGGIPALAAGIGFALALAKDAAYGRRLFLVFLALAVIACFGMPFHDPASILFSALCAGALARNNDCFRFPAYDGGSALRPRMAAVPAE